MYSVTILEIAENYVEVGRIHAHDSCHIDRHRETMSLSVTNCRCKIFYFEIVTTHYINDFQHACKKSQSFLLIRQIMINYDVKNLYTDKIYKLNQKYKI